MKTSVLLSLCIFITIGIGTANAQENIAVNILNEQSTLGEDNFLGQSSGSAGLTKCNVPPHLTGTRAYLVKNFSIYWGFKSECLRVVINDKASDSSEIKPTYLGIQIVGYYDREPGTTIILKRKGRFTRKGKALPEHYDRSFTDDQMKQDEFNQWHSAPIADSSRALAEFDQRLGDPWHGTPEGGVDDSWTDRFNFRDNHTFDSQISPKYKILEDRLVRYVPYRSNERPKQGPLSFDFDRRGARAVAIHVFSPANAGVNRQFVLIYSDDQRVVGRVLATIQVVGLPFFRRLFPSSY